MKYGYFILALLVAAFLVLPAGCQKAPAEEGVIKAAIVDQLYLREPNPGYIARARQMLESAGFMVDVWQGAAVTVDFYRKLPSLGYRLIVLRVHSGMLLELRGEDVVELENTYLFTAENYTTSRYMTDQLADKVSYAIMDEDTPQVFAVNSKFISGLKDSFNRTVVLAMGCESAKYDDLARAFIARGASAYVGWSDVVSLEHTDKAALGLLQNLCAGVPLADSVNATMSAVGKDPYFASYLKYYPAETGGSTVKQLIQ